MGTGDYLVLDGDASVETSSDGVVFEEGIAPTTVDAVFDSLPSSKYCTTTAPIVITAQPSSDEIEESDLPTVISLDPFTHTSTWPI
mmetsp:Transcript_48942/g.36025  ORF Transcript_48942/g.36025 Transcript_48942/m.36025 type:complete len:86 (-) Transcript_48942:202-459(-)